MNTPAAVILEASCPRCGRAMQLPLPADIDKADAERLARLIICNRCAPEPGQGWELTEDLDSRPEQPQGDGGRYPMSAP
jgi:hypothetical protein